jgi:hypothetical protein
VKNFLQELDTKQDKYHFLCVIVIGKNSSFHTLTKHIDVRLGSRYCELQVAITKKIHSNTSSLNAIVGFNLIHV